MSSLASSVTNQQPRGIWPQLVPYLVPPMAASFAIIPVFRDLIIKTALQKGQPIPSVSFLTGIKGGIQAAPITGGIVGTQMVIQNIVEKALVKEAEDASMSSKLASSAIVGIASSPALAVFNGRTMGWSTYKSLQKFSLRQGVAISVQETGFVFGLSIAEQLANAVKSKLGDHKIIDYSAAYAAGAAGSLMGHPANTALTLMQDGQKIDPRKLMAGGAQKAKGMALFALVYKLAKEALNSTIQISEE